MDWAQVHAEAEQLEHAISDAVLDRLDALLGYPATDPHGDPIPSVEGTLNSAVYATLATCPTEVSLRVVRVTDQSADFLTLAEAHGLRPGAVAQVVDRNLPAGLVTLRRPRGKPFALSLAAAGRIWVAPAEAG
jgi:DtxR family Mn-dependent transcriptional regulator